MRNIKSFVNDLQYRMSHLSTDSWHARLTYFAYGKYFKKHKACTYVWLLVPASPIVAGLKFLLLVAALLLIGVVLLACEIMYLLVVAPVGYLAGFKPRRWVFFLTKDDESADVFNYYRRNDPSWYAKKENVAPWWFIAPVVALVGLYYVRRPLLNHYVGLGVAAAIFIIIVVCLATLGVLYLKLLPALRSFFRAHCPPIVWEEPPSSESTDTSDFVPAGS